MASLSFPFFSFCLLLFFTSIGECSQKQFKTFYTINIRSLLPRNSAPDGCSSSEDLRSLAPATLRYYYFVHQHRPDPCSRLLQIFIADQLRVNGIQGRFSANPQQAKPRDPLDTSADMRPEFRSIKAEAGAKSRALYEAANPITCSKCSRSPKVKGLREHHHSHLWEKTSPVKDLGQSSSERQRSPPPTATPILPTPPFVGKLESQPELDPDGRVLKPLQVGGETSDGNKVDVPVGDKLQSIELKAPGGSTGVDTADEVKRLELDLSLHL